MNSIYATQVFAQPPGDPEPEEDTISTLLLASDLTSFAMTPALLSDSLALVDLYDSAGGNGWTVQTNWKSGNLNTWYGVTISGGRVTRLEMPGNNMIGKLPSSVGNLIKLTALILNLNQLSGRLPSSLGNLTALTLFHLHDNQFSGPIPATIGNLTNVTALYLYKNKLSGDIPSTLSNLTKLQYIGLHINNLTGNLDWVVNIRSMIQLYFYGNPNLDCTLPANIGNLVNLTRIAGGGWFVDHMEQQKLHGQIPASIGSCTKLIYLWLDNSELSGTIPSSFNNLKNLRIVSLFNNPTLGGDIASINGFTKLESLHMYNTNIGGTLPASVVTTNLLHVQIGASRISGTLPANFTNAINLQSLTLDSLALTQIPDWSNSFPKLTRLDVSNNQLTVLPAFENHVNKSHLQLYVDKNRLEFPDFENMFSAESTHPFATFLYSPQEKSFSDPSVLEIAFYGALQIVAPSGGQYGIYTWEKLVDDKWKGVDSLNSSTVPGSFVLASATPENTGSYRYIVHNMRVPLLSFNSGTIKVKMPSVSITRFSVIKKAGSICGSDTIVLSGSQPGVKYRLQLDSADISSPLAGTTQPLKWAGLTKSGTYSVVAHDTISGYEMILPGSVEIGCGYDSLTVLNTVGVGGPVPDGYSLAVSGKVIATGLNLKIMRQWPDYVFQQGYPLMPLRELEEFIQSNKHLPGVPSAADVRNKGHYDVGEIDVVMLEKIEELTLHLLNITGIPTGNKAMPFLQGQSDTQRTVAAYSNTTKRTLYDAVPPRKLVHTSESFDGDVQIAGMAVNQSLGIGLTGSLPAGYRLAVRGNVIAKGLDLKAPMHWPDYVFSENHSLIPLHELKVYIQGNKHLPGFASAGEMSEKGKYGLAEMDVLLLEKIEELALYLIQISARKSKYEIERVADANPFERIGDFSPTRIDDENENAMTFSADFDPADEYQTVNVQHSMSIGTSRWPPSNYRLAVGGNMIAESMDIQVPQKWPDYVFDSAYSLLPLTELAIFIKEHGHLPNIPSAAELNRIGSYNAAEMDVKILEKIEELTLYLIEVEAGR